MTGHIFEFEYDDFEFIKHASNIKEFIINMLEPDSNNLASMTSYINLSREIQWNSGG